jgi:hypothetical protein
VTVEAGEVVRFPPGQFQEGYNDGDEPVVGWALGAPSSKHDWDDIESVLPCSECGEETGHGLSLTEDNDFAFTCTECGNEVSFSTAPPGEALVFAGAGKVTYPSLWGSRTWHAAATARRS